MPYGNKQKQVRAYRGQIPSPGRPMVAWREDRVQFWAAIGSGLSTDDAAVVAGVSSPVGYRWFRHSGGVKPTLRPTVSGRYLSFPEREDIALLKAQGLGVRGIARRTGRNPSTISRELRRNASTRTDNLDYKASIEQWHAERRARRPKTAKLVANERLRQYVQDRLNGAVHGADEGTELGPAGPAWKGRNKPHRADRRWVQGWSPEQITQRLRVDHPDDGSMRSSHQAIYQALYVQSRGALKRELVACLRTGRALRVPRARSKQKAWAHVTPEVLISERPAEGQDRAVPGHWEGDLIIGLERSAIGTLVERTTRLTLLVHLPGRGGLPPQAVNQERTGVGRLRSDHDEERPRRHHERSVGGDAQVPDLGPQQGAVRARPVQDRNGDPGVLRRPHSPWQRGTNETTNGLLRQYFPKGTDLSR